MPAGQVPAAHRVRPVHLFRSSSARCRPFVYRRRNEEFLHAIAQEREKV